MQTGPTALTGKKTGRTLPGLFLQPQLDWINDEAPAKLGDKSRRTGWSYAEAYDKTSRRFRRTNPRNRDAWYAGVDESTAYEFIDYCRFWAKDLFGATADYFTERVTDPQTGRDANSFVIRCPNGARITGMTSNPRRFRSKGGDVILDEAAHHDEQERMYDAAQPTTMWGDQLTIFSNVNGETNLFAQFVKNCKKVLRGLGLDPEAATHHAVAPELLAAKARELGVSPVFSYHRVTIVQAVAAGLVELMNHTRGTKYTREEFLAKCRGQCRNEEAWQQEYLCTPTMNLSAALKYAVIEKCMDAACPAPVDGEAWESGLAGYAGGPAFLGMDIGRTQDLSVFWLLEAVGDVLWTRAIVRLANCSLVDQETIASGLIGRVKLVRAAVLKRGIGQGVFDHLERRFGAARIAGIDETRPVKLGLVGGIVQAFEDHRVRVSLDDGIKEALHRVREVRTPGGQVSYDAPHSDAGHADEFWALAAAVDCTALAGGGLTAAQAETLRGLGTPGAAPGAGGRDADEEMRRRRAQRRATATIGTGTW